MQITTDKEYESSKQKLEQLQLSLSNWYDSLQELINYEWYIKALNDKLSQHIKLRYENFTIMCKIIAPSFDSMQMYFKINESIGFAIGNHNYYSGLPLNIVESTSLDYIEQAIDILNLIHKCMILNSEGVFEEIFDETICIAQEKSCNDNLNLTDVLIQINELNVAIKEYKNKV